MIGPEHRLAGEAARVASLTPEQVFAAWCAEREGRAVECRFLGGFWFTTAIDAASGEVGRGHGVTPGEAQEGLAAILRTEMARRAAGFVTLANLLDAQARLRRAA